MKFKGKNAIIVGSGVASFELCRVLSKHDYDISILEIGSFQVNRELHEREELAYSGKKIKPGGFDLNAHLPDSYLGMSWVKEVGGTLNMWSGKWKRLSCSVLKDWAEFCDYPFLIKEIEASYLEVAGQYNIPIEVLQTEEQPEPLFLKHYEQRPPLRIKEEWVDLVAENEKVNLFTDTKVLSIKKNENLIEIATICNGIEKSYRSELVIIAAGGIESPRILLRSRYFAEKLPALGRFYMDHPKKIVGSIKPTKKLIKEINNRSFNKAIGISMPLPRSYRDGTGEYSRHCAYLVPKYYSSITVLDFLKEKKLTSWLYRGQSFFVRHLSRNLNLIHSYRMFLNLEQPPFEKSMLSVDHSTQDQLNWCFNEDFEDSINNWLSKFSKFIADQEYGTVLLDKDSFSIDDLHDASHPMGMTRMSKNAKSGVVDADLEVHGIEGLYVVSSSVFPFSGSANPTFTILALANRLGKKIVSIYRGE